MNELLNSMDLQEVLSAIWTVILVPVFTYLGVEIKKWAEARKIDKYTDILIKCAASAVKDVYETIVKNIKGTEEWTPETQAEVKELAKRKIIAALSTAAYKCLKAANEDFEEYLDSLVESSLFDIKNK